MIIHWNEPTITVWKMNLIPFATNDRDFNRIDRLQQECLRQGICGIGWDVENNYSVKIENLRKKV